ncbi:MAG: Shedu immune nuclease family protein [Candidatus Angelobacter sp.]
MKKIQARKVSENLFELDGPIILEENRNSRRIFHGQVAKGPDGEWGIRGWVVLEKKGPSGWHEAENVQTVSDLQGGELLKLELRTEHVRKLYQGLTVLYEASEIVGGARRSAKLVVGKAEELVHVPQEYKSIIESLIKEQKGPEFWNLLVELQPDLAAHLADAEIQRNRRSALEVFKEHLDALDWNEPAWESFFRANQWIFGYGLRYQFLSQLQNQANYGGADFTKKGGQRGEFLMSTEAWQRFTVLVEIKRPDSLIFAKESKSKPYRSGVPGFHSEFNNAISQVQVNARTWAQEGSRRERDQEMLQSKSTYTIAPRSLLIFGHMNQLIDVNHRNSFELFRSHLHRPEIISFDELYNRAKFIVEQSKDI